MTERMRVGVRTASVWSVVFLCACTAVACASTDVAPIGERGAGPSGAATATDRPVALITMDVPTMQQRNPPVKLGFPQLIGSRDCGDIPSGATPQPLPAEVARVNDHDWYQSAALVSVVSIGPAVYNTPDGKRWTEAWTEQPGNRLDIYTPYTVQVRRPLAAGVASEQKITAYVEGGSIPFGSGADTAFSCIGQPTVRPWPGGQAVLIFGRSLVDPHPGLTVTVFDTVTNNGVVTARGCCEPVP